MVKIWQKKWMIKDNWSIQKNVAWEVEKQYRKITSSFKI